MGNIIKAHIPCPGCGSSDAATLYDDGIFCYSCEKRFKSESDITEEQSSTTTPKSSDLILDGTYQDIPKRGLREDICRQYGYSVVYIDNAPAHVATYRDPTSNTIVAQKLRKPGKKFSVLGDGKGMPLFGQHLWRSGGKSVVITEGEIDCLSVAQAVSGKYPAVSLPNGAQSAVKSIKNAYEWLSTFDKVVVCFDMDEPGQKAALEVCQHLPPGKAYIMRLPEGFKDPNEVLVAKGTAPLVAAFWEAKQWRPDGIVNLSDLRERVLNPTVVPSIPYPWESWNRKLKGVRLGELVTFTAGSGLGKSTILRELMYHLAVTYGRNVGGMFLEESNDHTVKSLIGIHLGKNIITDPDIVSPNECSEAFDFLETQKICLWDHFGSNEIDAVISKIRYMVRCLGVEYLFLDHLSILVSGLDVGDERKTIDVAMTKLRTLCSELGIAMFLVSHLKRPSGDRGHEEGASVSLGQLRGSHSIAQLSDAVVGLQKNPEDPTSDEIIAVVLKNRFSGERGELGSLYYNRVTGRLTESSMGAPDF